MGRHLDAIERAYDGAIPAELYAAAVAKDDAEWSASRPSASPRSPDELAAASLRIRLQDATSHARFHLNFANRNRVYLRGQGKVKGNNWIPVFAKANAARRALRRELAAVRARIEAASDQTFHALAAE